MGTYTKNLFKRDRNIKNINIVTCHYDGCGVDDEVEIKSPGPNYKPTVRIISCGIIRDGNLHTGGESHSEIRRMLGDQNPYISKKTDKEGFVTSDGCFVDRIQGDAIAFESGQCARMSRELLSSDITAW